MTEVKCGAGNVPMDAATEFTGDASIVVQVTRFKPFTEWCGNVRATDAVKVKRIEVVDVGMVVGRINTVRLRVELESERGGRQWQALTLADEQMAALWVAVPMEGGAPHTVLVSGPSPAIVSDDHREVPFGSVGLGMFEAPCADLLAQLGLDLNVSAMEHLSKEAIVPGAIGAQAHKVCMVSMQPQRAAFKEQFPMTDGDYTLHLVPVADVATTSPSTRTLACLALYEREAQTRAA